MDNSNLNEIEKPNVSIDIDSISSYLHKYAEKYSYDASVVPVILVQTIKESTNSDLALINHNYFGIH